MAYTPPSDLLERYADLLVNYALGSGAGIASGDVVLVRAAESAKPLYVAVCRAVWAAGGHVIGDYTPDDDAEFNLSRSFFELASGDQLDFFPAPYQHGRIDAADHLVYLHAVRDPHALQGVDASKILRARQSRAPLVQWQDDKENAGRFTWTIGLYGTDAMAAEARMPIEEYWEQIIAACFLDDADPKARWREVAEQMGGHLAFLNGLQIDRLHVEGADADLWITVGERRQWIGGSGRNIPSFEVFTSPDWRGTEGWIRFSEPLYIYGSLITGIELEFSGGRVVRSAAAENEPLLKETLAAEGADRVGEFSLTDARLSRITRFMANTLFDENTGGPFGNTHLAVGRAIHQCYDGDPAQVTPEQWEQLGFNASIVHTDIISTTDRTVTAVLQDGEERVIYAGGRFLHDG